MTNDEMRVAIAETMGWKDMSFSTSWLTLPNGKKRFLNWSEGESWEDAVPDYPNDLNAMWQAEAILSEKQHGDYEAFLLQVCVPDQIHDDDSWWPCVHGTAAQRAEAFLRTIGKWKD